MPEHVKQRLEPVGTITLNFYFLENARQNTWLEVERKEIRELGTVSEKAVVKGAALSHAVRYVFSFQLLWLNTASTYCRAAWPNLRQLKTWSTLMPSMRTTASRFLRFIFIITQLVSFLDFAPLAWLLMYFSCSQGPLHCASLARTTRAQRLYRGCHPDIHSRAAGADSCALEEARRGARQDEAGEGRICH